MPQWPCGPPGSEATQDPHRRADPRRPRSTYTIGAMTSIIKRIRTSPPADLNSYSRVSRGIVRYDSLTVECAFAAKPPGLRVRRPRRARRGRVPSSTSRGVAVLQVLQGRYKVGVVSRKHKKQAPVAGILGDAACDSEYRVITNIGVASSVFAVTSKQACLVASR